MTLPTGNQRTRSAEPNPAAAFTLIELILVMAMLLIVLAVSAPSLSNFFRGRTLDSEARRFVSLTRYGQSRAVSEGVPMVLWIDLRKRSYGLKQEAGYTDEDAKAVEFEMGKELSIEVADVPEAGASARQGRLAQPTDPSVPTLRFQPDGFVGETSPQSVVIREEKDGARTDESIWITQSRNRLNYEIRTNALQNALR